ncbi:peptidoglycan-binding protein [Streptomyces sp. MBT27]|uniref:peptidoglycan-binding protein n=1 Tax=Streptomyces sp. MBT27 TaxID=1488356 RepID=UPI001422C6FD|nr:peptidoglycan-binding protein [Streptomyces sp. MBT27]
MQFVSRSAWGARPSRYALAYIGSTRGVKVHYEGSPVPAALARPENHGQCAGRVRDIQASHLANRDEDYSDIAYNAMVCPHGYVYEGRGAHRKTGANGNQSLNQAHYAVCAMVGDSGLTNPTDAQLNGVRDAIEWLRSSGGAGSEIKGHRDGYATSCPGGPLYAWVQRGAPRPGGGSGGGGGTPPTGGLARYTVTINGLVYGYGAHGDHVTAVGKALVAKKFGRHYSEGPGPTWTDSDTENYADYQKSLGLSGSDADGVPGESSLKQLLGYLPGGTSAKPAPPFPGADKFGPGSNNAYVTALGNQLVKKGYGSHYTEGPGPRWGEADRLNVRDFQLSRAELRGDPDGIPGPTTWRLLFS